MTDIYKLLSDALNNERIKEVIRFALDGAPEIKHEGIISALISAHLRSRGFLSRREVTSQYLRIQNENGAVAQTKFKTSYPKPSRGYATAAV